MVAAGSGADFGAVDGVLQRLSALTTRFAVDKLMKVTGTLLDANRALKAPRSDATAKRQEADFARSFAALEALKGDKALAPFALHIDAVAAALPLFATPLLAASLSTREHVAGAVESAKYYTNRIIMGAADADADVHRQWAKALNELIDTVAACVADRGARATDCSVNVADCSASVAVSHGEAAPSREAEPAEEPAEEPSGKEPPSEADSANACTPRLEGSRWYVRRAAPSAAGTPVIAVVPEAISQALAVEDSQGVAIRVAGKMTAITMGRRARAMHPARTHALTPLLDNCKRVSLEVDSVVSSVELVNCTGCRLVLNGALPMVVLDGCEAIQVCLVGAESRATTVLSSKCAEINVQASRSLLYGKGAKEEEEEEEEVIELALPVQFKTTIDAAGRLSTEPVSHVGA